MPWIKRNLPFVIGCAIALVLMGVVGWFAYSNWSQEAGVKEELGQLVNEWQRLNSADPYPNDENITVVKADQKKIKGTQNETKKLFPRPPAYKSMTDQEFAAFLGRTIADLRSGAAKSGVFLPDNYDFTFSLHRKALKFAPGSIEQWLGQLDEIRGICDVLYKSRINVLDGIQRVPVSPQDTGTPDFLTAGVISNQFGVFTPYQITFRSFSPEIAAVLEGMIRSTNCMIVKSISVVPSANPLPGQPDAAPAAAAATGRVYRAPQYQQQLKVAAPEDLYAERGASTPTARPIRAAPVARAGVAAAPTSVTMVSEQPLQTTILLDCVKLSP